MSITLSVYPLRSPVDTRRGIVRVHPQIIDELGLHAWSPIRLTGARTTGALAAPGPADAIPGALFADYITALNTGVVAGKTVLAEPLYPAPAESINIATPVGLQALADPTAIVHALMGKVIFRGDRVSILPQDFVRPQGSAAELQSLAHYLAGVFGPSWQDVVLLVTRVSPPGPAYVTAETVAEWTLPSGGEAQQDVAGISMLPAQELGAEPVSSAADLIGGGPIPIPQSNIGMPVIPPRGGPVVPPGNEAPDLGVAFGAPVPASMAPSPPQQQVPSQYGAAAGSAVTTGGEPDEQPPRLEDLGGLAEPIRMLREWFDVSFRQTEMLARLKISPLDGVLLYGLPGTGKSSLIRAVATTEGAQVSVIEGRRYARTDPGEAAKHLRTIFRSASSPPPQIIVIENIEELAPAPDEGQQTPLASILLEEIKAASARPAVAVVGVTSHPERTSPELRGPGLLDHALEISPPSEAQRREILAVHTRSLPLSGDVSLDEIAHRTPGFVGADLALLCRQAGVNAVVRLQKGEAVGRDAETAVGQEALDQRPPAHPDRNTQPITPITPEVAAAASPANAPPPAQVESSSETSPSAPSPAPLPLALTRPISGLAGDSDLVVTPSDFEAALSAIAPTSMADMGLSIADVSFDDVGDMAETKELLQETIIWPIRFPDTFARLGLRPSRGVLLYGPPGCGKTYLVKALAHEAEANFLAVKGAELLSKWVGESERAVRDIFSRARSASPAIIFFDEIDALAPTRGGSIDAATDRVVAQLLTELDGIEDLRGVWIVAATNRPDMVDPALVRPGRLERTIYVPPPDEAARLEILRASCRQMPLDPDVNLESIANRTEGYSGADLAAVARQAGLAVIRRDMSAPSVAQADFETALVEIRPSLNRDQLAELERFARERSIPT